MIFGKRKRKKYQPINVTFGTKTGEEIQKFMDVKEFRERGYLQEVNRRFLHPLGLALVISQDQKSGEEIIMGIWDAREDKEGIIFNYRQAKTRRKHRLRTKKNFIDGEFAIRNEIRRKNLGYDIEPID